MIDKVRSTTTVTWGDTVNNNAEWDTAWDVGEYAIISIDDLNLAYPGNSFEIEEIMFFGTGTVPALANRDDIQMIIASDSGFTDVVCFELGHMSDAKYDTTKCIAAFHPQHNLSMLGKTDMYITVKCGTGAALTATGCRITVTQE